MGKTPGRIMRNKSRHIQHTLGNTVANLTMTKRLRNTAVQHAQTKPVDWTKVFHRLCATLPAMQGRWFFCFGTLLTLVRDKGVFPERDDVDIGLFYEEDGDKYVKHLCWLLGFKEDRRIVNDVEKKPLYVSLSPTDDCRADLGNVHVDLFFWYKHHKQRYHTYDVNMENPPTGIPKTYYFKGIDANLLEETVRIDNIADSMMEGRIPLRYGALLDAWYPHWLQRRKEVSATPYLLKCKSCAAFTTHSHKKVQWPESA